MRLRHGAGGGSGGCGAGGAGGQQALPLHLTSALSLWPANLFKDGSLQLVHVAPVSQGRAAAECPLQRVSPAVGRAHNHDGLANTRHESSAKLIQSKTPPWFRLAAPRSLLLRADKSFAAIKDH